MRDQWSRASVALHWASAAIIVGLAGAGFIMTDLPANSSQRLVLSRLHTVSGFALMVITALRLVIRWRGKSPEALPLGPLHRRGVNAVHGLIYACIFALGASAVLTGTRSAWPDYLKGHLGAAPEVEHLGSRQAHEVFAILLLAMILLHVGGVIVQELRRGGVLRRMMPFLGTTDSTSEHEAP